MIGNWVAPALLAVVLLFGGSIQQPVVVLMLQWLSIAALGWAYATPAIPSSSRAHRVLIVGWAAAALCALQLLPLPPAVWHLLPGRDLVVAGDQLLGIDHAWRPLSLLPEATLASLMALSVPLAIGAVLIRRTPDARTKIAAVAVTAAGIGALWGLAQLIGAAPHPYAVTSTGPVGQFANTNHFAALMVASMPLGAGLVSTLHRNRRSGAWGTMAALVVVILAVLVVRTGSVAMIAMLLIVAPLSVAIAYPKVLGRMSERSGIFVLALGAVSIVAIGVIWSWLPADSMNSTTSRAGIWAHSLGLSRFMVAGAGFGSFSTLYQLVEDPFAVGAFYVNHAHNEFIELAIEGGILALILLALFVGWWIGAVLSVWRPIAEPDPLARAGAVSSMVMIVHSLVDFPLRTPALAGLMAAVLAMLAVTRPPEPIREARDLRPTRHRRIH